MNDEPTCEFGGTVTPIDEDPDGPCGERAVLLVDFGGNAGSSAPSGVPLCAQHHDLLVDHPHYHIAGARQVGEK